MTVHFNTYSVSQLPLQSLFIPLVSHPERVIILEQGFFQGRQELKLDLSSSGEKADTVPRDPESLKRFLENNMLKYITAYMTKEGEGDRTMKVKMSQSHIFTFILRRKWTSPVI